MSTTSNHALSQSEGIGTRFSSVFLGTLFAMVLLVPNLLHLRRNAHSWMFFRVLLGIAGAALVLLPLGLGNSYVLSLAGLAMFIAAILLPPAKPDTSADDMARELGAFVVVNGGRYQPQHAPAALVQLFVGPERICVLDAQFQPLLVVLVSELTSVRAEESAGRWLLKVVWADRSAEFLHSGVFAEHLARVAESTLQSVMRPSLPVIPQTRAASA